MNSPGPLLTRDGLVAPRARTRLLVLVATGYALLCCAWIVGNPAGAAPDEPAHYLKAIAAGAGDLVGGPIMPSEIRTIHAQVPALNAEMNRELYPPVLTRRVSVPARLVEPLLGCTFDEPNRSAACIHNFRPESTPTPGTTTALTYVGTYQPFLYVLPGFLMRLAPTPYSALIIGRIVFAVMAFINVLIALAVTLQRARAGTHLFGLLLATTPMALFATTSLGASGMEITGSLAVLAILLYGAEAGGLKPLTWLGLVYASVTLASSRTLGPVWLVADIFVVGLIAGRAGIGRLVTTVPGRLCTLSMTAAAALSIWWQLNIQPRQPLESIGGTLFTFAHSFPMLPWIADGYVGVFGWQDSFMPKFAWVGWLVAVLAVAGMAAGVARGRERIAIAYLALAILLLPPLMQAVIAAPAKGGVQSRWLLAMVIALPIISTEILARHRRAAPRFVALALALVVAGDQVIGWYANAHRYAVDGNGSHRFLVTIPTFLVHNDWAPPGGWIPWAVCCVAGAALLFAAAVSSMRLDPAPSQVA